jgi:hypothetical protein
MPIHNVGHVHLEHHHFIALCVVLLQRARVIERLNRATSLCHSRHPHSSRSVLSKHIANVAKLCGAHFTHHRTALGGQQLTFNNVINNQSRCAGSDASNNGSAKSIVTTHRSTYAHRQVHQTVVK